MEASYTEKYQQAEAAAAYDQVICRADDDAVWAAERELLKRFLRRYAPRDARAVDFACGTGRISEVLKPLVGELVGVDISSAMLERARQRVGGVEFKRVDVLANPEQVPDGCDVVTAFRFVLLAEPPLRQACIRTLAGKLKPATGVMILNTHGNPRSFRAIAAIKDRMLGGGKTLPRFSEGQMRELARMCGLKVVAATGCGFIPNSISRVLPGTMRFPIERFLAGMPVFWRFGTNLMFVLKRESAAP